MADLVSTTITTGSVNLPPVSVPAGFASDMNRSSTLSPHPQPVVVGTPSNIMTPMLPSMASPLPAPEAGPTSSHIIITPRPPSWSAPSFSVTDNQLAWLAILLRLRDKCLLCLKSDCQMRLCPLAQRIFGTTSTRITCIICGHGHSGHEAVTSSRISHPFCLFDNPQMFNQGLDVNYCSFCCFETSVEAPAVHASHFRTIPADFIFPRHRDICACNANDVDNVIRIRMFKSMSLVWARTIRTRYACTHLVRLLTVLISFCCSIVIILTVYLSGRLLCNLPLALPSYYCVDGLPYVYCVSKICRSGVRLAS
jgi:hypothetical protein